MPELSPPVRPSGVRRRLPLFPLPIVLFPGALLPLHVFEPRYRQLVAHCLEADKRFGLVYRDPDAHGPLALEGQVGCIAEILEFQPLPDGRSMVLSQGGDRFRIEDGIESDVMYLEALVADYLDRDEDGQRLRGLRVESVELFYRTLRQLDCPADSVPAIDRAADVSFQLAQCIRIDPGWQQQLLQHRSEGERLDQLIDLFQAILADPGRAETI